ncbi:response regulator [Bacteriovoracaceae bacterium]|nr:response regulator [Bacteriovoracaceae bacterium]
MKKKILIIEDEPLIRRSLKKLLEIKYSAEVVLVDNGKEAIEILLSQNFDSVICDIMLSDITGFEVIESIKIKYDLEKIKSKFVFITAYVSDKVLQKASQYGIDIYNKPIKDMNSFLERVVTND